MTSSYVATDPAPEAEPETESWLRRLLRSVGSVLYRPVRWWRSSLQLRVVSTTVVLSVIVLLVLAQFLLSRVTSGLLEAKERSAIGEAARGVVEATALANASDQNGNPVSTLPLINGIVQQLAIRAGDPPLYSVLMLASPDNLTAAPPLGSNNVLQSSLPPDLRESVNDSQRMSSTYTTIEYSDGTEPVAGFVVGAPLALRGAGSYEIYYLFPLTREAETLALLQRTLVIAGLALLVLVGGIAWLVTRQVVSPVRVAARTAERFSAGRLEERIAVHGQDDLAKLATSFNQMAGSLQRQISQLEDLSRVQRRFVSDVSHELRTPLTTVRMAADVLHDARADFDAATSRSAELLQAELDRFESLLTDLLEISRFDAGAAVLDLEPIDLRVAVERVVDFATPLAQARHGSMQATLPDHPCVVEADPRRVSRILRNLVVNAVEHGEGRAVVVTVADSEDAVSVGVRDHGVGLRPGESTLVFNRFWRGDPARARTTGGTGLGLAIALEDAHLHGGSLQAWGSPGDGSHFRLTLPRHTGTPMGAPPLPLVPADARTDRRIPLVAAARELGDMR